MLGGRGARSSGWMTPMVDDPGPRPQRVVGFESSGGRTNTLEEMCEFVADCPHFTPEWTDHGYLVIRNQNIRNGRLDLSNPSFTHKDDYDRRTKRAKPEPGDIIFTREAPMGEVCMLPKDVECCVGQRQVLLRPRKDVHGPYLFYALQSPFVRRQVFWNEGTGSTVSNVRIPTLKALLIPRLGSNERFAADCLRALDEKIELNRRMNETLGAMAQALFKSWFVDFEPVRAKIAGRDTGLPDHIADLFPNALDTEHRPCGWSLGALASLAGVNPESWSSRNLPETVEYVDLASTKWGVIESTQCFSWQDAPSRARRILRSGDTIIGTVRPGNGSFAFIGDSGLTGSTGFAVLRPHQRRHRAFVFLAATARENIERLTHLADGAAYPAVRPQTVGATQAVVVDDILMDVFSGLALPVLEKIESNKRENDTLVRIRDLLLPKLISGEIRAAQAERAVGAATGGANA